MGFLPKFLNTMIIMGIIFSSPAQADPYQRLGPYLHSQYTKPMGGSSGDAQYHEVGLVAPLPVGVLSGMPVIESYYAQDVTQEAPAQTNYRTVHSSGLGMRFVPHYDEGSPLFDLQLMRHGGWPTTKAATPYYQGSARGFIHQDRLPLNSLLAASDKVKFTIGIEAQGYAQSWQAWPTMSYQRQSRDGMIIDLSLPKQLLLGWRPSQETMLIGGGRRLERYTSQAGEQEWVRHEAYQVMLGAYHEFYPPFGVSVEGGWQTSRACRHPRDSSRGLCSKSANGIFASLGVESRFFPL